MDDDDDEEDFCSTHTQTHRIAEHTDRLSQQLTNAPFSILLICVFLLFTHLALFCSLFCVHTNFPQPRSQQRCRSAVKNDSRRNIWNVLEFKN